MSNGHVMVQVTKTMINALKKRPRNKKELREILGMRFPELSLGAVRKRVDRFLTRFEFWDLIELRDGKYCWKNGGFKGIEDYGARLTHSSKLIPALKRIAGIARIAGTRYAVASKEEYVSEEDVEILVACAEDHLRMAYPRTCRLLEDYRRKAFELERMRETFCANLMAKLRKEFCNETIVEPSKESKYRSFIGSNMPSLICSCLLYGSPTHLNLNGEKIWLGNSLIAKGSHLLNSVRVFISRETEEPFNIEAVRRIEENQKGAIEIRQAVEHEIRKIIIRTEHGAPMPGGCEICVGDR